MLLPLLLFGTPFLKKKEERKEERRRKEDKKKRRKKKRRRQVSTLFSSLLQSPAREDPHPDEGGLGLRISGIGVFGQKP